MESSFINAPTLSQKNKLINTFKNVRNSLNYKTNEQILFHKNSLLIYGPKIWYLIHFFALLNDEKKDGEYLKSYITFIKCIYELFPCPICKNHFEHNLKKYKIENYTPNNLLEWSCLIHNEVNKSNNKKEISPEEYKSKYFEKNPEIYFENVIYLLYTFASVYRLENYKYFKALIVVFEILIPDEKYKKVYFDGIKKYQFDEYNPLEVFKWVYLLSMYIKCNFKLPYDDYYNIKRFFLNVL